MKNYTYDEILARVLAGDDPQTIADEIANNLNSALKAAEETKRKVKEKEKEQLADLQDVANSVNRYLYKYYSWLDSEVTPEQLQETLKTLDEMMELFKPAFTKSKKDEDMCANSSCDCKASPKRTMTLRDLLDDILH